MYIFPTMRRTGSFCAYAMPPMMATAAAIYKRENKSKKPESGMVLEGADGPSRPNVIFDPAPDNPYKDLPFFLAIAWTGVLLPILLSALLVKACRKRRMDVRIPAVSGLALAIVAIGFFIFFGRVSIATAIGFRFAMAAPLVVAARYAIRALREKRWISSSLVFLGVVALAVLILPAFLRL